MCGARSDVAARAQVLTFHGDGILMGTLSQCPSTGGGSSGATPRSRVWAAGTATGWNCQRPFKQTSCRWGRSTGLIQPSSGATRART